jgi:hypothetical protein
MAIFSAPWRSNMIFRNRRSRPQSLQAVPRVHPHPDFGGSAGAADRVIAGRQHVFAAARKVGSLLHWTVQDSLRWKRWLFWFNSLHYFLLLLLTILSLKCCKDWFHIVINEHYINFLPKKLENYIYCWLHCYAIDLVIIPLLGISAIRNLKFINLVLLNKTHEFVERYEFSALLTTVSFTVCFWNFKFVANKMEQNWLIVSSWNLLFRQDWNFDERQPRGRGRRRTWSRREWTNGKIWFKKI